MKENYESDTLQYLQLLQNTISRMSTASAIFKGFSATIVSGISLISFSDASPAVVGLSFVPVIVFLALDIYYLRIERKMRYWYEQVRTGQAETDYRLQIKNDEVDTKAAGMSVWDCFKSPSIYLFYPAMIVVLCIIFVMKCKGVI